MKKLLAALLAAGMTVSASVTAFALPTNGFSDDVKSEVTIDPDADLSGAETDDEEAKIKKDVIDASSSNGYEIGVTGRYQDKVMADRVISVDVMWESMNFTYKKSGSGENAQKWDPTTHTMTTGSSSGWVKDSAKLTFKNHSNAKVSVGLSFEPDEGNTTVTGSFDNSMVSLATAVGTTVEDAPSQTAVFTVSGTLSADQTLGTIKVVIPKATVITDASMLDEVAKNGGKALLCGYTGKNDLEVESDMVLDLNGYEFKTQTFWVTDNGNLTITGNGTVNMPGGTASLWVKTGNCVIENGTFKGIGLFSCAYGGTLVINDGEFQSSSGTNDSGTIGSAYESGKIIINGGNFTSGSSKLFDTNDFSETVKGGTVIVRGGTFNLDPSDYVDTEYYTVTENDGIYTVTAK